MKVNCFYLRYVFIVASIFIVGSAQAVVSPYYAYGEYSTSRGGLPKVLIEEDSATNAGLVSLSGGGVTPSYFDCVGAGCPLPLEGMNSSWAEINADPVNGTVGGLAGSMAFGAVGGHAWAYGYISQVFQVGNDGSLQNGDAVVLEAGMSLAGTFTSNSAIGRVESLVFVNKINGSDPYATWDYLNWNAATEEYFLSQGTDLMLATSFYRDLVNWGTTVVDHSDNFDVDVQVGDLIRLETMLWVENALGQSDSWRYSLSDFNQTLSSSLTPITAGATLEPVPIPAALWLFGSGLVGLIGLARR